MSHPMTDDDQSACVDSIKRLTSAMREMLGMGPKTVAGRRSGTTGPTFAWG
jgi:hypothetical protein